MYSTKLRVNIVGAGLAGIITGLRLAYEGFKPVVFDKQKELRDATSSGAVSFNSLHKLYLETGFDSTRYKLNDVKGMRVIYPGGGIVTLRKSAYTMDRTRWLRGLADEFVKLGGDLELGVKVNPQDLKSDVLVGADGPASIIRRYIGGEVQINTPFEYVVESEPKQEWLYFYPDKEFSSGYAWIFPMDGDLVLGLDKGFVSLDKWKEKVGVQGEPIRRAARVEAYNGTKYQEGNIVLIGDAAGQANPFTRGGITPIIHASRVLVDCIKDGELDQYKSMVRAHPAFSPVFAEANRVWQGLTNRDLEFIGEVCDGLQLPDSAGLMEVAIRLPKALRRPRMLRRLAVLDRAFRQAYDWSL